MAKPHICQKRKKSCFLGAIDQALYVGIKFHVCGAFMSDGHEGFYLKIHVGTISGRIYLLILVILDLSSAWWLMLRSKADDRSMHWAPCPEQYKVLYATAASFF